MGQQIDELARFTAETRWDDIPAPVASPCQACAAGYTRGDSAGTERPEVRALRDRMAAAAGGQATVYGRGWPTNSPGTAALLNGIAGRSIELCEGLRLVSGQAACTRSCLAY